MEESRSRAVNLALWIMGIVGVFTYGILWLVALIVFFAAEKRVACPGCKTRGSAIPLDTLRGRELAARFDIKVERYGRCRKCKADQYIGDACLRCGSSDFVVMESRVH